MEPTVMPSVVSEFIEDHILKKRYVRGLATGTVSNINETGFD